MPDIRDRFEQFIKDYPHERYQGLQRQGYAYTDNYVNHALWCFDLITTLSKESAPVRAYQRWKNAHHADEGKNPRLFYSYIEDLMADTVTDILENQWLLDRNKEISHLVKCRMVILSGMAAAALFNEQ